MNRFRELRLQHGYSQRQLKDIYNKKYNRTYSAGAISLIESGKRMPELGALLDFADFYGVSLDYLLGRDLQDGEVGDDGGSAVKDYKRGRKWHLAEHLRELAAGISWRCRENKEAEDNLSEKDKKSHRVTEYDENMNMLKSLLEQAVILARRVEKNTNSWYRY